MNSRQLRGSGLAQWFFFAIIASSRSFILLNCPLTFDFSAWYASGTILALTVAIGLAVYGYCIALAGQPVFGPSFMKDFGPDFSRSACRNFPQYIPSVNSAENSSAIQTVDLSRPAVG